MPHYSRYIVYIYKKRKKGGPGGGLVSLRLQKLWDIKDNDDEEDKLY